MRASKYQVKGAIINVQSGLPIPEEEPIFILRAQDMAAMPTLEAYRKFVGELPGTEEHLKSLELLIGQFRQYVWDFPDRIKTPDTQLLFDFAKPVPV